MEGTRAEGEMRDGKGVVNYEKYEQKIADAARQGLKDDY